MTPFLYFVAAVKRNNMWSCISFLLTLNCWDSYLVHVHRSTSYIILKSIILLPVVLTSSLKCYFYTWWVLCSGDPHLVCIRSGHYIPVYRSDPHLTWSVLLILCCSDPHLARSHRQHHLYWASGETQTPDDCLQRLHRQTLELRWRLHRYESLCCFYTFISYK